MTSYIQLLKKIEDFCDAHYQIQRYGGEFREQMPNLSTESEKYPIVFVTPTSGVPMYDTNQISLDIYCVDVIQKDRENINTIVSDCHLILTDLYGYFSQGDDLSVDVIGQPSQTPLNNLDLDYVAGWMMTIVFEVDGYCVDAIPMSPITPGSGECEDATYTVEYADGTLIESGTIPSGGSKTVTVPDCPTCDSATWTLKDTDGNILNTGTIPSGGSADITAPDSTYSNSDDSYTGNVVSGGSLSIPDSDVNVNSVNEGSVVSVKDIDINVTDSSGSVTPDSVTIVGNTVTIDVPDSATAPVGATLMKTGQTTSYRTGDDGDIEAGRATDFFTLAVNNPFGSNARFTDELGGSTYTNNIVIDWSTYDTVAGTVLGYYRNAGVATWNNAIDNSLALSVGSFSSGWRLSNRREVDNICNYSGLTNVIGYSPFNITSSVTCSTTYVAGSSLCYAVTTQGQFVSDSKANSRTYIPCRTFTVTGTTLT